MKTLNKIFLLFVFFIAALAASCGSGSGTSAPPVDLPAPVSHLSISSPDSDGNVRVTGSEGTADAGTSVVITNTTKDGVDASRSSKIFLFATTQTVTAESDGSFQGEVEGEEGDVISVVLTKDGTASTLEEAVPDNVPPLPDTADVYDVSFDPVTDRAYVVANDGTDGFIYIVDLDTSSYEASVILTGASGVSRITVDPVTGEIMVLDPTNIVVYHVVLSGTSATTLTSTGIVASTDLHAGLDSGYVVISHTSSSPAMSYFDITLEAPTAVGDSETAGAVDQTMGTWIDIINNGTNDIVGLVSLMPDDTYYLTIHQVDTSVPSLTQTDVVALTGLSNPGSMALFDNGDKAVVTDIDNDVAVIVDVTSGTLAQIDVGDEPQGVAIDEANNLAYVANAADATVTVIDLTDNSIDSTENVGLTPTMIVVDPTGVSDEVVVLNTGDSTVLLLE